MKRLIPFLIFTFFAIRSFSQCYIDVYSDKDTVCPGDTVKIWAEGGSGYLMKNDFNNQTLGSGWSSTAANPVFVNPCGLAPNGACCTIGTTASMQRGITSIPFSFSDTNCTVKWFMKYGHDSNVGSCNMPDSSNEGVHLQYSTDYPNFNNWQDFPGPNINAVGPNTLTPVFFTAIPGSGGYWPPDGDLNNSIYYWHLYETKIPAPALSGSTKIRWQQLATSSAGNDAWSIDEIEIKCPAYNDSVSWSFGSNALDTFSLVLPPHPSNIAYDTCVVVFIADSSGNYSATDSINIHVNKKTTPDFSVSQDSTPLNQPVIFNYTGNGLANDSYTWFVDGISTYSGQGPHYHSFSQQGNHTVKLVVYDSICTTDSASHLVYAYDNTSINKIQNSRSQILVYPSLAKDRLTIEIEGIQPLQELEYQVFNSIGELISTGKINSRKHALDISTYPNGIYILSVKHKGEIVSMEKFVVCG